MINSHRIMLINHGPPYGANHTQEALDMLLAWSAFTDQVSAIWMDAGIFQLLKQQQPHHIGAKHVTATFPALALYDIKRCYVEEYSLAQYGLSIDELQDHVKLITSNKLAMLMQQQDTILHF